MSFEYFLAFNIALLAAIASPGPALLVAIKQHWAAENLQALPLAAVWV